MNQGLRKANDRNGCMKCKRPGQSPGRAATKCAQRLFFVRFRLFFRGGKTLKTLQKLLFAHVLRDDFGVVGIDRAT